MVDTRILNREAHLLEVLNIATTLPSKWDECGHNHQFIPLFMGLFLGFPWETWPSLSSRWWGSTIKDWSVTNMGLTTMGPVLIPFMWDSQWEHETLLSWVDSHQFWWENQQCKCNLTMPHVAQTLGIHTRFKAIPKMDHGFLGQRPLLKNIIWIFMRNQKWPYTHHPKCGNLSARNWRIEAPKKQ